MPLRGGTFRGSAMVARVPVMFRSLRWEHRSENSGITVEP